MDHRKSKNLANFGNFKMGQGTFVRNLGHDDGKLYVFGSERDGGGSKTTH